MIIQLIALVVNRRLLSQFLLSLNLAVCNILGAIGCTANALIMVLAHTSCDDAVVFGWIISINIIFLAGSHGYFLSHWFYYIAFNRPFFYRFNFTTRCRLIVFGMSYVVYFGLFCAAVAVAKLAVEIDATIAYIELIALLAVTFLSFAHTLLVVIKSLHNRRSGQNTGRWSAYAVFFVTSGCYYHIISLVFTILLSVRLVMSRKLTKCEDSFTSDQCLPLEESVAVCSKVMTIVMPLWELRVVLDPVGIVIAHKTQTLEAIRSLLSKMKSHRSNELNLK